MNITKITVHYGRTHSLPDYCNVKPGITYEATLEEGDDPEAAKAELQRMAQSHVEEECDLALEEAGKKAHFWQGRRYDLRVIRDDDHLVILPADTNLPKVWRNVASPRSGWRLEALKRYISESYPDHAVTDLTVFFSPDLLPDLREYQALWLDYKGQKCCLILPYDFDIDLLPLVWQSYHYANRHYYTRLAVNFLPWITQEAEKRNFPLVNCLDGDLSKLPKLEAPEPEIEPDMEEPIEYDDDGFEDDDDDQEEVLF